MTSSLSLTDRHKLVWPVALGVAIVLGSSRSVPNWSDAVTFGDKFVHFAVYGLGATLVARISMVQRTRPLGIYAAILIVSVFGVTDELHQHFTPGRSMDAWDWVADTLGAIVATVLYAECAAYRRLLETPVFGLFRKRRVEIADAACVIAADGRR
jgi:VanZ family protein